MSHPPTAGPEDFLRRKCVLSLQPYERTFLYIGTRTAVAVHNGGKCSVDGGSPFSIYLKLSSIDPNRYVESKQARLTRRRLKLFLISRLQTMTEATVLPAMPKTAT